MRRICLALVLALLAVSYGRSTPGITGALTTPPLSLTPVFADSFETDTGWMMFEELVGGNPCYGSGIGSVTRSRDVAYQGSSSLLVWANQARSTKSNHLIAYKRFSNPGQIGIWRYQTHAYIAPSTANLGQTGPEFSTQNTRHAASGQFKTATAGIQYIANSTPSEHGQWRVWREETPGLADWHPFITQTLAASTWYTVTLEADYTNNVYRSFSLQGGGLNLLIDLSMYHIAQENKSFTEEAFVLTVEAENQWNNCGTAGISDYQVYYDVVRLESNVKSVFLPVILK